MREIHKTFLILAISILVVATVVALFSISVEKLTNMVKNLEAQANSKTTERPLPFYIDYSNGQKIYVPAYSYLPGNGGAKFSLNILLSVRNTDPINSISLAKVDYYDTDGQIAKQFLQDTILLAPMETKEFFIEQSDTLGGSGANFFIIWDADSIVYEPVVEALMYGIRGNHSMEFKSEGLIIEEDLTP